MLWALSAPAPKINHCFFNIAIILLCKPHQQELGTKMKRSMSQSDFSKFFCSFLKLPWMMSMWLPGIQLQVQRHPVSGGVYNIGLSISLRAILPMPNWFSPGGRGKLPQPDVQTQHTSELGCQETTAERGKAAAGTHASIMPRLHLHPTTTNWLRGEVPFQNLLHGSFGFSLPY